MSKEDVIYRFLKARADIDENADMLSTLIEANRGIDAVELNMDKLESQKQILEDSDLSHCLLNVNGHLILLYPYEQRELYMNIKDELKFNGRMIEYAAITYAEAEVLKDFLDAANVSYKVAGADDASISFSVPQKDESIMDRAIEVLADESKTDAGYKYLMNKNLCWGNTMTQMAAALHSTEVSYIGSEGGTAGICINSDGAIIMRPKTRGEFISRLDPEFDDKIMDIVIDELKGETTPIKAIFGDIAKEVTIGMDARKKAMTKNEAMEILGMDKFPDIAALAKMKEGNIDGKKKEAVYSLIRMSICRSMNLEGYEENKMNKAERLEYENMHQMNVSEFTENLEVSRGEQYER